MDEEIRRIVEAERRRLREAEAMCAARLEKARAEARRLAERFAAAEPTLRKVVLFGSVASGRVRSERFDIDLGVEADRHGELLCIAEESEFPVDLLDLRCTSAGFRSRILAQGIVLYDAAS